MEMLAEEYFACQDKAEFNFVGNWEAVKGFRVM